MRNFLLCLATAGLTLFVLDRILPPMGEQIADVKLSAFAERMDEYDVLVLGSSQSYRGFDPSVFDRHTREAGLETCTFNLGIPGTGLAEAHGLLRRVADLEPANLRWVLIEAERIIAVGEEDGAFLTRKSIALHDLETTALVWPYLGQVDRPTSKRWTARLGSLLSLGYRFAGVGRGIPWIEETIGMGVTEEQREDWLGPLENGYQSLEDAEGEGIANRRRDFLERRGRYETLMKRLYSKPTPSGRPDATALPFFARIERLVQSMGAQPIFFTIRRGFIDGDLDALARDGEIEVVLSFDDAQRHPELYDVELTFDGMHFNRYGSTVFTECFGAEFVQLVKSEAR